MATFWKWIGGALLAVLLLGALILGWARPVPEKEVQVTREVTKVVEKVVKETVVVQATLVPAMLTPTPAPTQVPPTSTPTGALSIVTPTVAMTSTNGPQSFTRDLCVHAGEVAWHAENQLDGSFYGEAPVGGMSEVCGMVIQLWTRVGPERFLIYLPPHTVMWISGHSGGTGWYADSSVDVVADLKKQEAELLERDGEMKTTFIYLPQDASKFRLLTRIQVATVPTVTATPTTAPQLTVTATTQVIAKCNVGGESVGPAILEGLVDGKQTVVKLNTGSKLTLLAGNCFPFPSQKALDDRWPNYKGEFVAKWPDGVVVEK